MQVKITVMLDDGRSKEGVIVERVAQTELSTVAAATKFREIAERYIDSLQTPAKSTRDTARELGLTR